MLDKLRRLDIHYQDIEARLAAGETYADPALVARLNKEQRELEPLVTAYRSWCKAGEDLRGAEALLSDPDFKDLAQEEMAQAKEELERLEQLIPIQLADESPGIVVVGDIGGVLGQDVTDDLVDGVIPLLLEGVIYGGQNGLDLLVPVLIEVEFACEIDLHVGNTSRLV